MVAGNILSLQAILEVRKRRLIALSPNPAVQELSPRMMTHRRVAPA